MTRQESSGLLAVTSAARVGVCLVVGVVASTVAALLGAKGMSALIGWDAGVLLFDAWLIAVIARSGKERTRRIAKAEDAAAPLVDVVLLLAAVASLVGVGVLLALSGSPTPVAVAVALLTIALSWTSVHLVFALRYARLYFSGDDGIDFNEKDPPRYTDFAYLAFTVGMTFQVSDTDIRSKTIRATVLRHALLSYVFGAVILATTINLVAGLAK